MRAAVLTHYDKNGTDLEIRDLPIPVPEEDDSALIHQKQRLVDALGEPVVARPDFRDGRRDRFIAVHGEMQLFAGLYFLTGALLSDQHSDHPAVRLDRLDRLDGDALLLRRLRREGGTAGKTKGQ